MSGDPEIDKAVRRVVGIATLRRLHRMIADDGRREAAQARWAVRLGWAFAVCAVFTLAWLAFR